MGLDVLSRLFLQMNHKARILAFFILVSTLFLSFSRPAFAILGPYVYWKDVYIPAVYEDPNINLQRHIKETIMIMPMAMIDIIFSWVFPTGTKFIRDCSTMVDNAVKLSLDPVEVMKRLADPKKMLDPGSILTGVLGAAECSADWIGIFSIAQVNSTTPIAQAQPNTLTDKLPFPNTRSFLQSSFNNLSIPLAAPAFAQGYGYSHLNNSAILEIWRVSRNLTYLLSALLLVVMGLMVMLRVKISPQVIITIEQVIPKLAITLLLITFSFTVVGFLIDLSYLAGYLVSLLIASTNINVSNSMSAGFFNLFGQPPWSNNVASNFEWYFNNNLFASVWAQYFSAIIMLIDALPRIFWAFRDFIIPGLGLLVGILVILIVMIILIIWAFLTFFSLLKVYVTFIGRIIFAPFIILFGLMPGGSGFGPWIMGLIQDLVTFLAVSIMFIVAKVLLLTLGSGDTWTPPQLGINSDLALVFIAIGILMNIRKAPDMVAAFFARKPFDFGTAMGEAINLGKPGLTPIARSAEDAWAVGARYRRYTGGGLGSQIKGAARSFFRPSNLKETAIESGKNVGRGAAGSKWT
ncbi:MAG: hypothetical protein UW69_C0084G0002 [Microgenomates group bacterium GW2011_GWA2_44_7]|nr:MAG: hypothetical protein UW69_C0084G0002 [Microgenomates group bacterium GW2011_GWA2_44_7]KKT77975.1 MAG: hypothetical protein UW73_C0009G0074 [Microgenomates group bacterium GW2011_GWB1_44_8]